MLLGKQDSKIDYDQLSQYIEGWLFFKENKKYERFWFVLRGNVLHGRDLCKAYLFCFKDLNIHVEDNVVGTVEIHPHDKVELLKYSGNKPMKCDFTILLNATKFHFRADDEISRERWIYALCDLIGKSMPPSELPTERNNIRASLSTSSKKKENDRKSAFHRSKTVELPSTRPLFDRRRSTPIANVIHDNGSASNSTLGRTPIPESPEPVIPPPRSICSLPFMLDPHVQLNELKWFYPGLRRDEAQAKLAACPTGYYLLRDSESSVGSYTLTFKDSDRIKNHMIAQSSDRLYRFHNSEVNNGFASPQKAVEFYMIKKHSVTLTPVPYCRNNDLSSDRDYLLPEEINPLKKPCHESHQHSPPTSPPPLPTSPCPPPPVLPSPPTSRPQAAAYQNRELPPTPDSHAMRNLSIPADEDYLTMKLGRAVTLPRVLNHTLYTHNEHNSDSIHRSRSTSDDTNGYLKVMGGSMSYDPTTSIDDAAYLDMEASPGIDEKESDGGSDSSAEPAAKFEDFPEDEVDGLPEIPKMPKPRLKGQRSISFTEYDSVTLQKYENQDVVDGAVTGAPPIPPRSSKPLPLPPRRETAYRS